VDPFDVEKVSAAANKEGVQIIGGLTTHHHLDHSGGNKVRLFLACSLPTYTATI
jgi:hydroxyacylglutathione hydrolase